MVTAAQALGTRAGPQRIDSIHLLGAAVGNQGDWRTLNAAVHGTVYNYYSTRDMLLKLLYSAAELGQGAVGETGFGSKFQRIKDRSVSRTVGNHSDYLGKVTLI